ncbi:hypothetical protein DY218_06660 [Streptomyces triticagri]|uniref:Uncharacterized protein n=2 Tax=Streptomyces triticagri TaxID=2293568 RepID=A0A372M9D9_9ACTN|nr:hypothetical protein DY218_06660 [Streptomyces triticagri]
MRRRVLAAFVFGAIYFGLGVLNEFVLPWGDRDLGKAVVFAAGFGVMAAVTFPGWDDDELARCIRAQLPTGETVTMMLPVRAATRGRPYWFVPDSRVLVLTGTRLVAYGRNRLTGNPTGRLWQYGLADATATATASLSGDGRRLAIAAAGTPDGTGGVPAVEHFHIQLKYRKRAARFVTLSQRGPVTE